MVTRSKLVRISVFLFFIFVLFIFSFLLIQHKNVVSDPKNNCTMLASYSDAKKAFDANKQLTKEFESFGNDVKVGLTEACAGKKGIVSIYYSNSEEKKRIEHKINQGVHYGVQVEVVKKSYSPN